jgi:hypothetical protein
VDTGSATVIAAGFAAISSTIGVIISTRNHRTAKAAGQAIDEVNDAVNHRHRTGEGSPRLYDAMLTVMDDLREMRTWRDRWDNLPADIADSGGLAARFDAINAALDRNDADHARIVQMIEERHAVQE